MTTTLSALELRGRSRRRGDGYESRGLQREARGRHLQRRRLQPWSSEEQEGIFGSTALGETCAFQQDLADVDQRRGNGWQIGGSPIPTANYIPASDVDFSVPVNLGFAKINSFPSLVRFE